MLLHLQFDNVTCYGYKFSSPAVLCLKKLKRLYYYIFILNIHHKNLIQYQILSNVG